MRIFFITILFILSTYLAYSQNFGIQAGVRFNTSSIKYSDVEISRKAGFEGGVFYQHPMNTESLSLRAAILYFNQEFSLVDDMGNGTGITHHFVEDNLKLPLTIEWHPLSSSIKPFLQGGLYTSYSISGKIKGSDSNSTLKYKQGSHKLDYGVVFGIGIYLTPQVALGANYEYGFANRNLRLGDQFVSVKNRACSVAVHYLF